MRTASSPLLLRIWDTWESSRVESSKAERLEQNQESQLTVAMAPQWVFSYFAPTMGTLLAEAMWFSSIKAVRLARQAQDLGELNPLPWGFGVANCVW
jgi:hypothetical protein